MTPSNTEPKERDVEIETQLETNSLDDAALDEVVGGSVMNNPLEPPN